LAGDITGTTSFALTGANQGNGASGQFYTGFGSASGATTITGAVNFGDTTKVTQGMTFASAADVTGTGNITGVAGAFHLTGVTTGDSVATGIVYHGFTTADATTITGAVNFNDGATSSEGMTFASAASVTGTGNITNVTANYDDTTQTSSATGITYSGFSSVAGTLAGDITGTTSFALTGANQGNGASGQFYTGFGSASGATTITGAVNFNDGATSSEGMTFASAASVTGTGTISNVAGAFDDSTQISAATGIDYAGFTVVTGTGTTLNNVATAFNDSSKVSAATGINYSGYSVNTVNGTGGNVTAVAGTFNVTTKVSGASGINYGGFNVGTVSGTGGGAAIVGSGQTYNLTNGTPNAGTSGTVTWSAFPNIADATGILNMQTSGSVTGNVTAQTVNYGSYGSAVTFSLSGAAGTSTGIGGTRSGTTVVTGSPNSDAITGSGASYNLTSTNSGLSGSLSWTSFENISDSSGGTFNLSLASNNITGTLSSGGTGTLNSSLDISTLNLSIPGTLTLSGSSANWNLSGAPQPSLFQTTNPNANVYFNGACIGGPACGTVIAIVGSIGASVSQIASQAVKDAQSTDSVAKQIDYGFAGDVGTTPPMDHRIDETGISTPDCFEESRENVACKN